jgi:hypothetical protein
MAVSDGAYAGALACQRGLKFIIFDGKVIKILRGIFGTTRQQTMVSVVFI